MTRRGQTGLAEAFAALAGPQLEDEKIDLVRAALTIARAEYPLLDVEFYAAQVEEFARRVEFAVDDMSEPAEVIAALNHILFEVAGFEGNREDYYDPRNSFLNDPFDAGLQIVETCHSDHRLAVLRPVATPVTIRRIRLSDEIEISPTEHRAQEPCRRALPPRNVKRECFITFIGKQESSRPGKVRRVR